MERDRTHRHLAAEEVTCQIRFQGQWADEESGLHYNRFRYYDAEAGQYISSDPIGLAGGVRPQGYVADPRNWVDPFGLAGCPPTWDASSGVWRDAGGNQVTPNVTTLPQLKGKSVTQIERILTNEGYTPTNPQNPKNNRWVHPDGSEVAIHKYGNTNTTPYRSGNNAHVHKSVGRHQPHGPNELNDRGFLSSNANETHIGIKNPADYPAVAGRPHGS